MWKKPGSVMREWMGSKAERMFGEIPNDARNQSLLNFHPPLYIHSIHSFSHEEMCHSNNVRCNEFFVNIENFSYFITPF